MRERFVDHVRDRGWALIPVVAVLVFAPLMLLTPTTTWFPLLWTVTGGLAILAIVYGFAAPRDRSIIAAAVIIGLTLRAWTAWLLHGVDLHEPDPAFYWNMAHILSAHWDTPVIYRVPVHEVVGNRQIGYFVYAALHVQLIDTQLIITLTNALVGVGTGVLGYFFARRAWPSDRWVALGLVWILELSTVMIMFQSQNFRDALAMFGTLTIATGTVMIIDRLRFWSVTVFVAGMVLMIYIRSYIAFIMVPPAMFTIIIARRRHRLLLLGLTALLGAAALCTIMSLKVMNFAHQLSRGAPILDLLKVASQGLSQHRMGSSSVYGVSLNSWGDLLYIVPLGFIRSLFAGLPWKVIGVSHTYTPATILRYLMIPLVGAGILEALRTDWRRARSGAEVPSSACRCLDCLRR